MKTLPHKPWRGSQICGYQTAYGLPWSIFCGEFKKPGSPLCEEHDKQMREENGGTLPKFAPGNALGLTLEREHWGDVWIIYGLPGVGMAYSGERSTLEESYGFTLQWEPREGDGPVPATDGEIRAWKEQD